jgi:hypothetical protein
MMSVFMEGIGVKRMERGTCHQTIHYSGQLLRCYHRTAACLCWDCPNVRRPWTAGHSRIRFRLLRG